MGDGTSTSAGAQDLDEGASYGLAELAAVTGVSARTIRYYQGQHLLPGPAKRGRDAVYGPVHVERLRMVTDLRDRGLNLHTIRDLVSTPEPTDAVRTWLGIDATLRTSWSQDRPRSVSHAELVEIVAATADSRPGLIGELADAGYLERDRAGSDRWTIPSPALLEAALTLQRAGIDVDVSARMRDLLRRRLAKAVDDTVELLVARAGAGFAGDATPEQLETALDTLRPVAADVVGVLLGHEVDRALDALVQTGLPRSRRTRR